VAALSIGLAVLRREAPEGSWESSLLSLRWLLVIAIPLLTIAGILLVVCGRRLRDEDTGTFLTAEGEQRVVAAIRAFERRTSGEMRVHLTRSSGRDVRRSAQRVFDRLGMTKTVDRNGVLFFVDVAHRRFAVVGDAGVDRVVGDAFWASVAVRMEARFREGAFVEGLEEGVRRAGEALAEHFPYRADDVNELPDDLSRD
jgi:uncharacterized membrane protein